DKARVLDGLAGAAASSGTAFDRSQMERLLSRLGKRVFLVNNVHEDHPVLFQSRWALSYLRGPLTRDQIHQLMHEKKNAAKEPDAKGAAPAAASSSGTASQFGQRPVLPPGVSECFLPQGRNLSEGAKLVYRAAVVGTARVHFSNAASSTDVWEDLTL